jgi:hypothetical protein
MKGRQNPAATKLDCLELECNQHWLVEWDLLSRIQYITYTANIDIADAMMIRM